MCIRIFLNFGLHFIFENKDRNRIRDKNRIGFKIKNNIQFRT